MVSIMSLSAKEIAAIRVGDEVILRNGDTVVVTYIAEEYVEGFNRKGWNVAPMKDAIVDITHRHFTLPIDKE